MQSRIAPLIAALALLIVAGAALLMSSAEDIQDLGASTKPRAASDDVVAKAPLPEPTGPVRTDRLVTDVTPQEGAIQGTVVRPDGTHIAGAVVRVRLSVPSGERNYSLVANFDETVTTDAEGRFSLENVPGGGVYRIVARGEAFAPGIVAGVEPGDIVKVKLGRPAALAGTVLEEGTDRSLAGVNVIAKLPPPLEAITVKTDGAGSFRIDQLPAGLVIIDVDAPEHVVPDPIEAVVTPGTTETVVVRLVAGKEITGSVFASEDDRPLPHAIVTAGRRTGITDARGQFVIRGLATKRHDVVVNAWGHLPDTRRVSLAGSRQSASVVFKLHRGATITGRVLDVDGRPVQGAPVRLFITWREQYNGQDGWEDQATRGKPAVLTDEWGQFEIAGIARHGWACVARTSIEGAPDAWSRPVKVKSAEDRLTADIQLGVGGSVSGIVTDQDENPIGGARVQARMSWSGTSKLVVTGTGDDGRFEMRGLTEGRYTVTVDAKGYARGWKSGVKVDGPSTPEIDFTLVSGEPLDGIVTDSNGDPLSGVRVDAWAKGGHGQAMTDSKGVFQIESVPKGPWRIRASLEGYATWNKKKVSISGEKGIEISLSEQAVITGRVVEASSGEPIRDFRMTLSKEDSQRRRRRTVWNRSVKDENGRFSVQLPNQTVRLDVQANGYVGATIEAVTFEAGTETEPMVIELRKGAAIEGYVRDEQGRPISSVSIYRRRSFPADEMYSEAARTEADGYFFIGDLDPGAHDLAYYRSGRTIEFWDGIRVSGDQPTTANANLTRKATLNLIGKIPKRKTAPQSSVRNRFRGWGNSRSRRISVKITSLDHQPHHIQRGGRDPVRGRLYVASTVRTLDLRSRYQLAELPPGRYRIEASLKGMPTITRVVSIGYGEAVDVTFDYQALAKTASEAPAPR